MSSLDWIKKKKCIAVKQENTFHNMDGRCKVRLYVTVKIVHYICILIESGLFVLFTGKSQSCF